MNKVVPFKGAAAVAVDRAAESSSPAIDPFTERCFERFKTRHQSRGLEEKYTTRCLGSIKDLMQHCGKPIYAIEETDYESWCRHLATERKLRKTTQRTYQKGVRQVIKYIFHTKELQLEAEQTFGRRFSLFAHPENSIIHRVQEEDEGRCQPMSHDEVNVLFDYFDEQIDRALIEAPRMYRALCRDKVMYYVIYVYGLRASEVGAIKFSDWASDRHIPECGRYAYLRVRFGKGSNASGKRSHVVPTTVPGIVELLDWYRTSIRTLYKSAEGYEETVFVSEHGAGVSASTIDSRLAEHLDRAGFKKGLYSPHSLRRSMVTHELMRGDAEFGREKARHKDAKTTVIYGKVPFEHVMRRANALIRQQLKDAASGASDE